MAIMKKVRGTIETIFRFGIGRSQVRSLSTGELEVRNAADSDYAILRGLAPVGDNDLVTKKYADTLSKPIIVKRQADTSSSIPNNTAVRGFVVVTTAGSGANIGDVLFDDGTSVGQMEILTAIEGRTIAVTDALTGGTISFDPDSIYMWDEDGVAWVKVGDIGNVTGPVRIVRYAIDNSASQDSTFEIPANNRILRADLEITTPFSGGATIEIGNTSVSNLVQLSSDNSPQTADTYSVDQDTDWGGSDSVVRTTVSGAPAAGAGVVTIHFTNPNA